MNGQERQYSKETMDEIIRSLRDDNIQTRELIREIHKETLGAIGHLNTRIETQKDSVNIKLQEIRDRENFDSGFKKAVGIILAVMASTVIGGIVYVFSSLHNMQLVLATLTK
jgi:hypothetical protein